MTTGTGSRRPLGVSTSAAPPDRRAFAFPSPAQSATAVAADDNLAGHPRRVGLICVSGATTVWAPLQPLLGAASIALRG